jgi:hypothetical protein
MVAKLRCWVKVVGVPSSYLEHHFFTRRGGNFITNAVPKPALIKDKAGFVFFNRFLIIGILGL